LRTHPRTETIPYQHAYSHPQAYLSRVRKQLDCRSVSYVSVNKDSHVLEVPEAACGSVPPVLLLVGQKKGFKRYSSEELKELVAARTAREEEREAVESGVLQVGAPACGTIRACICVRCNINCSKAFPDSMAGRCCADVALASALVAVATCGSAGIGGHCRTSRSQCRWCWCWLVAGA
jgi:hypothetical protein